MSIARLPTGQFVAMREHLARHYYPRYRDHVAYTELREAGQAALVASMQGMDGNDPVAQTTAIYRHMRNAIVQYGQDVRRAR